MDVSQENKDVTEQLDSCISRKLLAPLQGKTWPVPQDAARSQTETEITHKAAQQEMADVTTANTPGSDTVLSDPGQQPGTSLRKTAEQPRGMDIWNAVCCKNHTRARSLLSVVNLITITSESIYSSTRD